jgi:hypothetical protein
MQAITTIGLDIAKSVFRFIVLMQTGMLFSAVSCAAEL